MSDIGSSSPLRPTLPQSGPPEKPKHSFFTPLDTRIKQVSDKITSIQQELDTEKKNPGWVIKSQNTSDFKKSHLKILKLQKSFFEKILTVTTFLGITKPKNELTVKQQEPQQKFKLLDLGNKSKVIQDKINTFESVISQRLSELESKIIDYTFVDKLESDELVGDELAQVVKDLLKTNTLTHKARTEFERLDREYVEGKPDYASEGMGTRIANLYKDGRIDKSDLKSVIKNDPIITANKVSLSEAQSELKPLDEEIISLVEKLTLSDSRKLPDDTLKFILSRTTAQKIISLSSSANEKLKKDEESVKNRERELQEQALSNLAKNASEEEKRSAVQSLMGGDTILAAWKSEIAGNKRILPVLNAALYDKFLKADDKNQILSLCSRDQLLSLATLAKPKNETITNFWQENIARNELQSIDTVIQGKDSKAALGALTSEERISIKKNISSAQYEILETKKATVFTPQQQQAMQAKLDKLESVNKDLVSIMKEHANAHLLQVIKGKKEAIDLYPDMSVEQMQEAILTANSIFLPSAELLEIIGKDLQNHAVSLEDKKALVLFLAKWVKQNAQTNELAKNKEALDALVGQMDDELKKIYSDNSIVAPIHNRPLIRGSKNFQSVLDELLSNRFGIGSSKYNEAVNAIANDLFLIALHDYERMTVDDLFYPKWAKKQDTDYSPSSPTERDLVENFNKMSDYLAALFIRYPTSEERARVMKFFINVAIKLKNNGHLLPLMAVKQALTNTGVLKMAVAQNRLQGYETELKELEELTSVSTGFKNLFTFAGERSNKVLPYYGATKPRITKVVENPKLDPKRETYNFNNFKVIKNEMNIYLEGQSSFAKRSEQTPKTTLEHEIRSHKLLSDKEFDDRIKELRTLGKEIQNI